MITVVYVGHQKVVMTDYNGKRYCFEKDIPKEIPEEVYKSILLSGHIDAMEFKQVETPKEMLQEEIKPEKPVSIKEAIKTFVNPRGRPKRKKR